MSEEYRNALPEGFTIDTYRIESALGEGGFGITYLVRELNLDKLFAMKELLPDGIAMRRTGDTSYVEAKSSSSEDDFAATRKYFISEARILAKLKHASVVSVQRLMEANGTCYMVMDYVEGDTLGDYLKKQGGVLSGSEEFKKIFFPLMAGLELLHAQGIIHRDIKPGNIMVKPEGSPVLLDFGAATQVQSKTITITQMLSAGYSPFEQYTTRAKQGPYTDIYALGATMFKCITGRKPDDASDRVYGDAYQPLVENETYRSIYGTALLGAIDAALIMDAKQRPQDIVAWRDMMERQKPTVVMAPEPQPRQVMVREEEARIEKEPKSQLRTIQENQPVPEPEQAKKKKQRGGIWGGVVIGLVAMVALIVMFSGPSEEEKAEAQAKQKELAEYEREAEAQAKQKNQERLAASEREVEQAHRKKLEEEIIEMEKQRLEKLERDAEGIAQAVKTAISNQDLIRARAELAKLTNRYAETVVYRSRASLRGAIDVMQRRLEAKVAEKKKVTIAGKLVIFRWCPAESFKMGDISGSSNERSVDQVIINKGFWMGESEVTQGLWQEVMGSNPSHFKKGDDYPVEQVSWEGCQEFISKVNASGKLPDGVKLSLPTEAQWEYACRAGTRTVFHYGDSLGSVQANFNGNYPYGGASKAVFKKSTVAVKTYGANAWGLYDMHGNVWEWCADWSDGKGQKRVMRGGGWVSLAEGCRSAKRFWNWPDSNSRDCGFRLSLQLDNQ